MFLGNDMHEVSDEKKKSFIYLTGISNIQAFPLLLAITPFILYHIFMDMNVQGKNGRQKKIPHQNLLLSILLSIAGYTLKCLHIQLFFLLDASTLFFLYVTHIQTTTKKGNWKKGDCELCGRMKKEKWNEIKFLRCGGKIYFFYILESEHIHSYCSFEI